MFRFRIWDNESQEYLENLDSFSMDSDGEIRWYDGSYLNGVYVTDSVQMPGEGRYEVEYGNAYCFHNDIIQGSRYGGHWRMENAGNRYYDDVPREYLNMHVIKGGLASSVHDLYWDIPIRGVALMIREVMEIQVVGITCKDQFYEIDGGQFSWGDISVVGNFRFDKPDFCKKKLRRFNRHREFSILPPKEKTSD